MSDLIARASNCYLMLVLLELEVWGPAAEIRERTKLAHLDPAVRGALREREDLSAGSEPVGKAQARARREVAEIIAGRLHLDHILDPLIRVQFDAALAMGNVDLYSVHPELDGDIAAILVERSVVFLEEVLNALLSSLNKDDLYEAYELFEAAFLEHTLGRELTPKALANDSGLQARIMASLPMSQSQWLLFGHQVAGILAGQLPAEQRPWAFGLVAATFTRRWSELPHT